MEPVTRLLSKEEVQKLVFAIAEDIDLHRVERAIRRAMEIQDNALQWAKEMTTVV